MGITPCSWSQAAQKLGEKLRPAALYPLLINVSRNSLPIHHLPL
jgi:hypothetical protein